MLQYFFTQHNNIYIIFAISLILRFIVFHLYLKYDDRFWQVDSNTYHLIGTEMAKGSGYSGPDGQPAFYRLPGYPFFLSFCYRLFGHDKQHAIMWQTVIASCIPVLIYMLGLTLFPGQKLIATMSSFISVFHLGFVLYAGFFMSESLFIIFLLLFLLLFLNGISISFLKNSKRWINLFSAGLILGLASLIRPVGHYVVVVALIEIFMQGSVIERKLLHACSFFIGWLIPVSILLVRNYLLLGGLFFHTLPGGHFLYLSAARVAMHPHCCSYQKSRLILHDEVDRRIGVLEQTKLRKLNEYERCLVHEKLAVEYFVHYPHIALKYWITDMLRTMFSLYSAELLYLELGRKEIDYFAKGRTASSMINRYLFPETDKLWLKIIIWSEIIFYFMMLCGFLLGFVNVIIGGASEIRRQWLQALLFMALFIIISLAGGYARMRLPIEPFIIILSVHGWYTATRHYRLKSAEGSSLEI